MPGKGITIALGVPEVRVAQDEETEEAITVEVQYRQESAPCPRWAANAQGA